MIVRRRTTRGLTALVMSLGLALGLLAQPAAATSDPSPGSAEAAAGEVVGVSGLDVERYLGTWYQIAAVPAVFELQCRRDVTAEYTLVREGVVGVRNECRTWFGRTSSVTGEAKVLNSPDNSELNVSFLRLGGRYVHLGGANYVVTGLGADYDWAVVGDPDRTSGFILSRTPDLTEAQLDQARTAVTDAGYDPCEFRLTVQSDGQSERGRLC
ncbi:apolipoprotein D and lipocalin family protein [Isoptericola sp. CG 20/1183]|uniref:Apolipoprotein D and lipocalin family protein n=1 Tax=Isoptericola halotolerans TaxID=300560 RepID=A0ABX5EJ72_9MICO|nr:MULTISPECIES: lipocalin family protein [Isoptericola]MCK0117783.1 lipocalin family protein [Isoptericola sp. S6320L]PRZ08690.1 apolipoprotein D and lipocalin family protein [Isoptericola halotolerans]PRZ10863.1 apolipoprotein D and lipocalin family protein [Isoptericola sp. CG 20/1183]